MLQLLQLLQLQHATLQLHRSAKGCNSQLLAHGPIIVWIHILRREEQVALAHEDNPISSEDSERICPLLIEFHLVEEFE